MARPINKQKKATNKNRATNQPTNKKQTKQQINKRNEQKMSIIKKLTNEQTKCQTSLAQAMIGSGVRFQFLKRQSMGFILLFIDRKVR